MASSLWKDERTSFPCKTYVLHLRGRLLRFASARAVAPYGAVGRWTAHARRVAFRPEAALAEGRTALACREAEPGASRTAAGRATRAVAGGPRPGSRAAALPGDAPALGNRAARGRRGPRPSRRAGPRRTAASRQEPRAHAGAGCPWRAVSEPPCGATPGGRIAAGVPRTRDAGAGAAPRPRAWPGLSRRCPAARAVRHGQATAPRRALWAVVGPPR
jgi:hypothetical protein